MRECRTCGIEKDLKEFYKVCRKNGNPEERHTECKACTKARLKEKHCPTRARISDLRRNYGITLQDYDLMYEKQNGQCAICGTNNPGGRCNHFAVDHNHETGAVRELLCNKCNTALGLFQDSSNLLRLAAAYLDRHQTNETTINYN